MFALATCSIWIVRAQGLIYGYYDLVNISRYPAEVFGGGVPAGLYVADPRDRCGELAGAHFSARLGASLRVDLPAGDRGRGGGGLEPTVLDFRVASVFQRQFLRGDSNRQNFARWPLRPAINARNESPFF